MRLTAAGACEENGASAAGTQAAIDPRIRPAAHEFEACLMKELLEPLQHDALFDEKDGAGDGSGGTLMSFGSEALAKAVSDHGGFGIAAKIIDHFTADKSANCGMGEEI